MTQEQEKRIRTFIRDRRCTAERRRKTPVHHADLGSQPRSARELNIAMVAEETAKIALLNDLEALLNQNGGR